MRPLLEMFYIGTPSLVGLLAIIWALASIIGYLPQPGTMTVIVVGSMLMIVGLEWSKFKTDSYLASEDEP